MVLDVILAKPAEETNRRRGGVEMSKLMLVDNVPV